jgi:hypothetical protein
LTQYLQEIQGASRAEQRNLKVIWRLLMPEVKVADLIPCVKRKVRALRLGKENAGVLLVVLEVVALMPSLLYFEYPGQLVHLI